MPIAVVTGASRGIGLAASEMLGHVGFAVLAVAKDADRLAQSVQWLQQRGITARGLAVDVSDAQAVALTVGTDEWAQDAAVLVNSAGVMSERTAKTLRTTADEWHRVMSINVDGAFHMISAVVPGMVERRSGRVINVSACLGRFTGPGLAGGLAPYRVSKAALNAMTKNLAAETGLGKRGVLVDAMCPNHTRTDMGGPDAPRSPQEAADTIVWLATREHTQDTVTGVLWEDRQQIDW